MRRERIPLKRDVVTTETVAIGSLAARIVAAERELLDAERQLEQMLDSLFGERDWKHFEVGPRRELDVYAVTDSAAAVAALHRAGFPTVVLHAHERAKFTTCACRSIRDPLT